MTNKMSKSEYIEKRSKPIRELAERMAKYIMEYEDGKHVFQRVIEVRGSGALRQLFINHSIRYLNKYDEVLIDDEQYIEIFLPSGEAREDNSLSRDLFKMSVTEVLARNKFFLKNPDFLDFVVDDEE